MDISSCNGVGEHMTQKRPKKERKIKHNHKITVPRYSRNMWKENTKMYKNRQF